MNRKDYRRYANIMIYLAGCAVNGKKPKTALVQWLTDPEQTAARLSKLYRVAERHTMGSVVSYGLSLGGIENFEFKQAKYMAIRKNVLFDLERAKVLQALEDAHIWYMPLKGILLKALYPEQGMREMADNDILFDPDCREQVRDIMTGLGFRTEHYGGNHDVYYKEPMFNFEMHVLLFSDVFDENIATYYTDVFDRLIKDQGNDFGYHFGQEDCYLYIITHEYKHYIHSGTGVRSLLDTYVFLKKTSSSLNWDYIRQACEILGIADFEEKNRTLAMKLFRPERLNKEERERLDYHIFSGVYGNHRNYVNHAIEEKYNDSVLYYLLRRFFPTAKYIKDNYPYYYEHPWLMPVLLVRRPIEALVLRYDLTMTDFKYALEHMKK